MSKNFPTDEFDAVPAGPGRLRAKRSGASKTLEFFAYFFVSALVAGGGLFTYQLVTSGVSAVDVAAQSDNGVGNTDPLRVNETTILDGTGKNGVASSVAHDLVGKGWNVVTADNLPANQAPAKTTIYINADSLSDAGKAMVSDLGSYPVEVSNQYIDPITVVLGADFKK